MHPQVPVRLPKLSPECSRDPEHIGQFLQLNILFDRHQLAVLSVDGSLIYLRRKMIRSVFTAALCFVSLSAAGYSDATSVPKSISQYGNGDILVEGFTFTPPLGAGCTNGFVWIKSSHPFRKEILSQLLAAKSAGSEILMRAEVGSCYTGAGPFYGTYPLLSPDGSNIIVSK